MANGKYKFKGEWRPLKVAYSLATPYASEFPLIDQAWAMTTAKNLAEMKQALEQLDGARNVSLQDVIGLAFSTQVYKAETWQERIRKADPDGAFAKTLATCNRRSDAGSLPALAFTCSRWRWKMRVPRSNRQPHSRSDRIRTALCAAEQRLKTEFRRTPFTALTSAWDARALAARSRWAAGACGRPAWRRLALLVSTKPVRRWWATAGRRPRKSCY